MTRPSNLTHLLPGGGPRLLRCGTPEELAFAAAGMMHEQIIRRPEAVVCAATGATPTRMYGVLAERRAAYPATFSKVRVVKLDEWLGLPLAHPGTCETYLRQHLLGPLHVPPGRYLGFASAPADAPAECVRVREALRQWGGIDMAVLGLGLNGHLGLNEPGDHLEPVAHVAELSAASRQHAMLAAATQPVTHGLTLGLGELLAARQVLLLVTGATKGPPLRRLLTGGVTTQSPASFLWLHPNVTWLVDAAALEAAGSVPVRGD